MPGAESLRKNQYYAHPRNAFWPLMGALVGAGPDLPYPERLRKLTGAGIVLWDVLASCSREGSLDAAILPETETPNDVAGLILANPGINAVAFNGRKAEAAFRRHVAPRIPRERIRGILLLPLPSTSPAHAGRSFDEKLEKWKPILSRLARPHEER